MKTKKDYSVYNAIIFIAVVLVVVVYTAAKVFTTNTCILGY